MGLELLRSVDSIDLAVIGEADTAFPSCCGPCPTAKTRRRYAGSRAVPARSWSPPPPSRPGDDLDALPPPDYTEILRPRGTPRPAAQDPRATRCGCPSRLPRLLVGRQAPLHVLRAERDHDALPQQVPGAGPRRLATLARRYRTFRFEAVDNILDPRYLTSLFPAIVDSGPTIQFFYEIKANLTRTPATVLVPRWGDPPAARPGIAELPRPAPDGQRRARRAERQPLRWARYYGIDVAWSILWGFPGETAADYAEQTAVAPPSGAPAAAPRLRADLARSASARCSRPPGTDHRNAATGSSTRTASIWIASPISSTTQWTMRCRTRPISR